MWFNIVCLLKISLHCFAFSRKKKKKKDCTNKHCVLNDFVVYFSSRDDTVQHVSSLQSIFRVHDSSAIPHSFFFFRNQADEPYTQCSLHTCLCTWKQTLILLQSNFVWLKIQSSKQNEGFHRKLHE